MLLRSFRLAVLGLAAVAGVARAQYVCTKECGPRTDFETGAPTQVVCEADWLQTGFCRAMCRPERRTPSNLLLGCAVICPAFHGCRAVHTADLLQVITIACDTECVPPPLPPLFP